MTRTRAIQFLAVLLPLALAACEHANEPGRLRAEPDPFTRRGRVQFEDGWTKGKIKIVSDVKSERLPGGQLKLTVTFRNTDDKTLWCPIKTTFLDATGHELDSTNFELIEFHRSTVKDYTCTSLSDKAADYQIIIQKARKSNLRLQ